MVSEAAAEQIAAKSDDEHVGLRIAYWVWKRDADIDNIEKSVRDGLQNIAFGNDKVIDYTEHVRVRAPSKEDQGFSVEILRLTAKREVIW